MKQVKLFLLLLVSINVFSQDFEEKKTALETIYKKIPISKYENLIPFCLNDKWGYLDAVTKKVLIPAMCKYELGLAYLKDEKVYFYGDYIVNSKGEVSEKADEEWFIPSYIDDQVNHQMKKGFSIKNDEIDSYSSLYQYDKESEVSLYIDLFKENSNYYAIVRHRGIGKYGIIDSLGNSIKGFEFKYDQLKRIRDDKELSFFTKEQKSQYSNIKSFSDSILFENLYEYPVWGSYGLSCQSNQLKYGVFDKYKREWFIKPQDKMKINGAYFRVFLAHNKRTNIENRDIAKPLFLIDANDKKFYVGLDSTIYLPSNMNVDDIESTLFESENSTSLLQKPKNYSIVGKWKCVELNVNVAVDNNKDGIYNDDLLKEDECVEVIYDFKNNGKVERYYKQTSTNCELKKSIHDYEIVGEEIIFTVSGMKQKHVYEITNRKMAIYGIEDTGITEYGRGNILINVILEKQ